nr:MAG TPA: hypothetical protein [Caudoviricetes sp.]
MVIRMKDRVRVLKAMHTLMLAMNDEGAYLSWISLVPDGVTDDEFEEIADNEQYFGDCVNLFRKLWRQYNKSGVYAGHCNF